MKAVTRIGLDIAKNTFQVHGVNAHGAVVMRKQLSRGEVLRFFANVPTCLVGIEACAGSLDGGSVCGGVPQERQE